MEKYSHYLVLDMGGSLNKLCFFSQESTNIPHLTQLQVKIQDWLLCFNKFNQTGECFQFIDKHFKNKQQYTTIAVTGGGYFKYKQKLQQIGKAVINVNQFDSLIQGINFFKKYENISEFIISTFIKGNQKQISQQSCFSKIKTPFLIVNIGSGVSILKVSDQNQKFQFSRIGGTSLGGGFFIGLSKLLINQTNYDNLVKLSSLGNNQVLDSFELNNNQLEQQKQSYQQVSLNKLDKESKKQDIAKSLFKMVSFNIVQMAFMHSDLNKIQDIIFTGSFCRNNGFIFESFEQIFQSYQNFQEKPITKRIYNLKHDGYLGTIGSINKMLSQQEQLKKNQK